MNVYEKMAAIMMMVMKREVKRLAHWEVSPKPKDDGGECSSGLGYYRHTTMDGASYSTALLDSLFFRNMPCGTRFASFT